MDLRLWRRRRRRPPRPADGPRRAANLHGRLARIAATDNETEELLAGLRAASPAKETR